MAATIHNIGSLDRADDFRINGYTPFAGADPESYFAEAHAVASFITGAISEAGGLAELPHNEEITAGAIRAVETLLGLGMLADRNRSERRERLS